MIIAQTGHVIQKLHWSFIEKEPQYVDQLFCNESRHTPSLILEGFMFIEVMWCQRLTFTGAELYLCGFKTWQTAVCERIEKYK